MLPPVTASPDALSPAARSHSRWDALPAAAPAAFLLAFCLIARRTPPPLALAPGAGDAALASIPMAPSGFVLSSQTMVVSAKKVSGSALLRARLQPAMSVAGRAPLSGQVARVLVREGQVVQVNDRVLQISTGPTSRPSSRLERSQDAAESAQVQAVGQQTALQGRMSGAQARLKLAQERVANASRRVEAAQQVVLKLRRGESVSLSAAEAAGAASAGAAGQQTTPRSSARTASRSALPARNAARESARERERDAAPGTQSAARNAARRELRDVMRDSQNAQRLAEQAVAQAEDASRSADDADKTARLKTQKLTEVRTALEIAQKRMAEGAAKADDVEAVKSSVSEAETEAASARAKAAAARREAGTLQSAATAARTQAQKAAAQASRSMQKLQLFSEAARGASDSRATADDAAGSSSSSPSSATPSGEPSARRAENEGETRGTSASGTSPSGVAAEGESASGAGVSVAQAARLVRAAMAESDEAIRAARRIKAEVDAYEQQVRATRSRLDSTGEDLQAAQQRMMNYTIQANLSAVRAPSSGVVLSVAPVAQEVSAGETIVVIGRSDLFKARFADYSGAWKRLKPGDLLPAVVQRPVAPVPASPAPAASPVRAASDMKAKAGASKAADTAPGMPVMARVRLVRPPLRAGAPAILETVIFNPRRASSLPGSGARVRRTRRFRPGMAIMCSVDKPGERTVINVPSAAIMRAGEGRALVAVLRPAPSLAPLVADETPGDEGEANADATAAGAGNEIQNSAQNGVAAQQNVEQSEAAQDESGAGQNAVAGQYHIEWRSVVLGAGDGVQHEIVSGLSTGERVALQPAALRTFELSYGPQATVRVETGVPSNP